MRFRTTRTGAYRGRSLQALLGCASVSPVSRTRTARLIRKPRAFRTEEALVRAFVAGLHANGGPWKVRSAAREFDYQRGRTDVVAVSGAGRVLSFEAKLERWKDAMHQAYRNTCFAHMSYVLLPEPVALRAKVSIEEFNIRGVGICTVRAGKPVVIHQSQATQPLQPWLSERATAAAKPVRSACRTPSSKQ